MHPVSGLFHSPLGVLFTFPSQYLCTIGQSGVFSLGGWSPHIQTGFHVSRPTQELLCFLPVRDYHPLWCRFPTTSSSYRITTGLFRVRSPLLTESRLMSFPLGTEMFHFPRFASPTLCIQVGILLAQWVPPFGNFRIKACSQLPETYRSVPRPSSPLIAKASTRCTLTLEFNITRRDKSAARNVEILSLIWS